MFDIDLEMGKKRSRQQQSSNVAITAAAVDSSESGEGTNEKTQINKQNCSHVAKSIDINPVKKNLLLYFNGKKSCAHSKDKDANEEDLNRVADVNEDFWVCLRCGARSCSMEQSTLHFNVPRSYSHALTLKIPTFTVWCHGCKTDIPSGYSKKLKTCISSIEQLYSKQINLQLPSQQDTARNSSAKANKDDIAENKENKPNNVAIPLPPPKKAQPVKNVPAVRGLTNLGNTCFFNSVLQCLAQTPGLVEAIRQMETPDEEVDIVLKSGTILKGKLGQWDGLSESLADTLLKLRTGGPVVSPDRLLSLLTKKQIQFQGYRQQDAHELFTYLIDSVRMADHKRYRKLILSEFGLYGKYDHQDVPEETTKKLKALDHEVADSITFAPEKVFQGRLVNRIQCQECRSLKTFEETFLDLSLPIVADKPQPPCMRRKGGNNSHNQQNFACNQSENLDAVEEEAGKITASSSIAGADSNSAGLPVSRKKKLQMLRRNRHKQQPWKSGGMNKVGSSAEADVGGEKSDHTSAELRESAEGGVGQALDNPEEQHESDMDGDVEDNSDETNGGLMNRSARKCATTEADQDADEAGDYFQQGMIGAALLDEEDWDRSLSNDGVFGNHVERREQTQRTCSPVELQQLQHGVYGGDDSNVTEVVLTADNVNLKEEETFAPKPSLAGSTESIEPSNTAADEQNEQSHISAGGDEDPNEIPSRQGEPNSSKSPILKEDEPPCASSSMLYIDECATSKEGRRSSSDVMKTNNVAQVTAWLNTSNLIQVSDDADEVDCEISPLRFSSDQDTAECGGVVGTANSNNNRLSPQTQNSGCSNHQESQPSLDETRSILAGTFESGYCSEKHGCPESPQREDSPCSLAGSSPSCSGTEGALSSRSDVSFGEAFNNSTTAVVEEEESTETPEDALAALNQAASVDIYARRMKRRTNCRAPTHVRRRTVLPFPAARPSSPCNEGVLENDLKNLEIINVDVDDVAGSQDDGNQQVSPVVHDRLSEAEEGEEEKDELENCCDVPPQIFSSEVSFALEKSEGLEKESTDGGFLCKEVQQQQVRGAVLPAAADRDADMWCGCSRSQRHDGSDNCCLHTSLVQSTQAELMTGCNKIVCDNCTSASSDGKSVYTNSTKQTLISKAPPALVIHLKRFQVQMMTCRKLSRHVSFPLQLDLTPYSLLAMDGAGKAADKSDLMYSLYGVVEHSGTMNGGHYVAYVKVSKEDDSQCWYCISDSHVSQVTESRVLMAQAYLLFYKKCTAAST